MNKEIRDISLINIIEQDLKHQFNTVNKNIADDTFNILSSIHNIRKYVERLGIIFAVISVVELAMLFYILKTVLM